jgi:soluble lytic murein transglycosylase-like protein
VPRGSRRLVLLAAALLVAAGSWPLEAALVVLDDGRFVKATGFDLQGDRVSIRLPEGGRLALDLDRIERILDDEVEPEPPAARAKQPSPSRRSVRGPDPKAPAPAGTYGGLILAAAREHHLDPALISAVIRVESNFSPRAVSPKGACGLMQLMPSTARKLGVTRPFDPGQNIRGGAAYLSMLAERFGETEVELILAAYNAGERAVESFGGIPPYRETREYVRKVAAAWEAVR